MEFETKWSYLKFADKTEGYVNIPDVVLEACVGHGRGAELLTELEGNILECLISAEQEALEIEKLEDIIDEVYWDYDQDIDSDAGESGPALTVEKLKSTLDSLHKRGFIVNLDYTK